MEKNLNQELPSLQEKIFILGKKKKSTIIAPAYAYDFQKWKNFSMDPAGVLKIHIFLEMSHNFHKNIAAALLILGVQGRHISIWSLCI